MAHSVRWWIGTCISMAFFACATPDPVVVPPPPPPPAPPPPPPPSSPPNLALQVVATGLSGPLLVTAPTNDTRLFVVEKRGRIRIVKNGVLLATAFLDITSLVSTGSEQGLLGLAFHPRYTTNGRFVIDYTDVSGNTQVVTYQVSANADVANAASARIVLSVAQPYANHNGGNVVFGPDGMLFVGMGDGGSGGDPQGHAQNANDLLGSLLRLQINDDGTMQVPSDNPFVGVAGKRAELWDLGLRNPWRFSFDRGNGDLYIADVGQGGREEVDIATSESGRGRGNNYGWNVFEGTFCYNGASLCSATPAVAPTLEYTHNDGCSITGGFVYRGSAIPVLQGTYFYADYCSGWVRSFVWTGIAVINKLEWAALRFADGGVTSFGEDAAGELYITSDAGTVWRIVNSSSGVRRR